MYRAFATFSVASTLALILIGSLYLLLHRYLSERSSAELAIRESEAMVRLPDPGCLAPMAEVMAAFR